VQFEVIADPTRPGGIFSYFPDGTFQLLTGGATRQPPETPYNVTVIKLQYDGIANWPDRPWNLVADLNALVGALVYHGTDHYGFAAQQVINNQVPPENITTTVNSKGGVTTTGKPSPPPQRRPAPTTVNAPHTSVDNLRPVKRAAQMRKAGGQAATGDLRPRSTRAPAPAKITSDAITAAMIAG
jgi:hypothetical protein